MLEQEMEHPQDQTRGEPLFLINYINLFNSRGQFPSYLIRYSTSIFLKTVAKSIQTVCNLEKINLSLIF